MENAMNIYDFKAKRPNGTKLDLSSLKGKALLIVNTASKCGFTPQFDGLEALNRKYADRGLVVLGFPCGQFANQELETADEIHAFCKRNYGVTFEILDKIEVNGPGADPLFAFLRGKTRGLFGDAIKWNFTKFLVSPDGASITRFAPTTVPARLAGRIEKLLARSEVRR
jgi:glutathione peroxidase